MVQNVLNFMCFFGNFWQNHGLAPPPGGLVLLPTGNLGSAPAIDHIRKGDIIVILLM